jgi:hypothetical protein
MYYFFINIEEMIYVAKNDIFTETILTSALQNATAMKDAVKDYVKDTAKTAHQKITSANAKLTTADKKIKDIKKETDLARSYIQPHEVDGRSIVARAKNSVLQFPVYITGNIRVNEAQIIAKMFERVYATLVQTVLSQNKYIDEEEANSLVFLKNFHTNISEAVNAFNEWYKPIDEIDTMMCESVFHTSVINDSVTVEFRAIPTTNNDIICENARLINEPLKGFAYITEADMKVVSKSTEETETNIDINKKTKERPERIISYAELDKMADELKQKARATGNPKNVDWDITGIKLRDQIRNGKRKVESDYGVIHWRAKRIGPDGHYLKLNNGGGEFFIGKNSDETTKNTSKVKKTETQEREAETLDAPHLLKDSDIKKINGLLPYTIEAHFRIKGSGGISDVRYIIGIKTVLHAIEPKDLAGDIHDIMTGDINSLRKIRYKTGEISFKDYWLNLSSIKADAAKHINYDKRWISTLKRLGEYRKLYGTFLKKGIEALTGGKVPIPNATMVLLHTDVSDIKDKSGIDISSVSIAKKLAHRLFMISIVIVDPTRGTMKVLFPDSDVDWDVQSIAAIDAEVTKTDNSQMLKELNKMVNR